MRPANQQQAERHMEHLLNRKLKGDRSTRVKEHTQRAKKIAALIWKRFQVGPYQYQLKHLKWYMDTKIRHLKPDTQYRHWLTVKNILKALNKEEGWMNQLKKLHT
ncbi:MAG: hypothetical protein ACRBB6_12855 [Neptuniibacter sp.]